MECPVIEWGPSFFFYSGEFCNSCGFFTTGLIEQQVQCAKTEKKKSHRKVN
jgi:hypothetical protein